MPERPLCPRCRGAWPLPGANPANPRGDEICNECVDTLAVLDAAREHALRTHRRTTRVKAAA